MEVLRHGPGLLVLEPREELARDAEARRHDAARRAGVHAFGQHLDREQAIDDAPERRRAPELVVVAAARVETDHEIRLADAGGELLHVGGQVGAAALLARLDQDQTARMRHPRALHRFDRGEGTEHRVAVVLGPAAIEPIPAADGLPGTEPVVPAHHLRLLVAVAVEQDGLRRRAGHVEQHHRRASGDPERLDGQALDGPAPAPVLDQRDGALDVAIGHPVRVEAG